MRKGHVSGGFPLRSLAGQAPILKACRDLSGDFKIVIKERKIVSLFYTP
jgi:hypothetical protein